MGRAMWTWGVMAFVIAAIALSVWAWRSETVKMLRAVRLENRGVRLTLQGHVDRGEILLRNSLRLAEEVSGSDDADVGMIVANLAQACHFSGKTEESEQLYKRAIAAIENTQGRNGPFLEPVLGNFAVLLDSLGRIAEADALRARQDDVVQANQGNPLLGTVRHGIITSEGFVYEPPGWRKYIEAAFAATSEAGVEEALMAALSLAEEQGAAGPHLGETLHLLGEFYFQQKHFVKAADFLERAVTVRELAFSADNEATESSRELLRKVKDIIEKPRR